MISKKKESSDSDSDSSDSDEEPVSALFWQSLLYCLFNVLSYALILKIAW